MANPRDNLTNQGGLDTHPNDLDSQKPRLSVARNVVINRDGMIERRRGFADFSAGLPDFKPQQIFSAGDFVYANIDDGLWVTPAGSVSWRRVWGNTISAIGTIGGLFFDSVGEKLYMADTTQHCIWSFNLVNGIITNLAGLPGTSGTANGTGIVARFNTPVGVWGDGAGNLYVCDKANFAIRKIVISTGVVTTFAGLIGTSAHTDNAVGTNARFQSPLYLWGDGTYLYVTERDHGFVRKVEVGGTQAVTTLVSGLTKPMGAWIPNAGATLYILDTDNLVKAINASSGATTLLATITAQDGGFNGMVGDGTYLWCTTFDVDQVVRVKISDGSQTNVFPSSLLVDANGIAVNGDRLMLAGGVVGKVVFAYVSPALAGVNAQAPVVQVSASPSTSAYSRAIVRGPT